MPDFTFLHVHSHYSLLGGTASIPQLVQRAQADDYRHLALTDSNGLYGAVAFARECRTANIQPIIGMTIPVAAPLTTMNGRPHQRTAQLILLAQNPAGYRSLCQLATCLQGHPEREKQLAQGLSWDELKEHRDGLICLDDGPAGWLMRYLQAGEPQAATQYAAKLGGIFEDNGYLALHGSASIWPEAIAVGQRFGLRPVATPPIYCLEADDVSLLRLLATIEGNGRLSDTPPIETSVHWHTPDEIADLYRDYPEALANVSKIAQQCGDCLPDGQTLWPDLQSFDSAQDKSLISQSPNLALTEQAQAGLTEKYGRSPHATITTRLQTELSAINQQGFAPLFLLVADIVRFARDHNVPVSTRGSVANSLVAYCLGITTVDPIAHNLIFERFLNPARRNLPDIDLDFCSHRRDEVLNYVRQTYGEDRVALVAMLNTFQPKSAVRETAKAYGFDKAQMKQLARLMPGHWRSGELPPLEEVLAEIEDEAAREVVTVAWELIGRPRHLSVHPGGIVITPGPLTDTLPVQWANKGFLMTQYDHADLEAIGLPKIDLLGIRALTVLADTADLIRARHDPDFRLENLPLEDERTADLLRSGQTIGVFQCESSGAQRTLRQLQVKNVPDLAIANAFFKPGPAMGGNYEHFIRRYRGEAAVTYLHPALEPILRPTQGVLLFQEQVLRVAVEIAGLSWAQADHLRRGMSKMNRREMALMRLQFVAGCQAADQPLTAEQAETLWEQVIAFSGYGFNQGHATAYADVSYRSAYLKAHYPAEFICARLADAGGFHHPAIYMAEARRLGLVVQPPHVNVSGVQFTLADLTGFSKPVRSALWMGLGQVRDLRQETIRGVLAERPFSSLRDLLARVPMQTKEITHLIQCGALDGLSAQTSEVLKTSEVSTDSRAALLAELESVTRAGNALQLGFDFGERTAVPAETLAQRFEWEQRLLGLPVSVQPLDLVAKEETADDVPLRFLHRLRNQPTTIAAYRLPGWTGDRGFFMSDGHDFVIVQMKRAKVPLWESLRLSGVWREDEWGNGRFEASQLTLLPHNS